MRVLPDSLLLGGQQRLVVQRRAPCRLSLRRGGSLSLVLFSAAPARTRAKYAFAKAGRTCSLAGSLSEKASLHDIHGEVPRASLASTTAATADRPAGISSSIGKRYAIAPDVKGSQ